MSYFFIFYKFFWQFFTIKINVIQKIFRNFQKFFKNFRIFSVKIQRFLQILRKIFLENKCELTLQFLKKASIHVQISISAEPQLKKTAYLTISLLQNIYSLHEFGQMTRQRADKKDQERIKPGGKQRAIGYSYRILYTLPLIAFSK